jgi:GNAT superfamily N-acetyltransferase
MPIDMAPLPLEGEGLHVIRCLWVVQEAQGGGHARALMEHALGAAEGAKGVAIVTYPGWNDVPASFLAKFGFEIVQRQGMTTLLLRKASADARVSFAPVRRDPMVPSSQLHVETAISGMCPAATQYYRRLLAAARSLSDKVVTRERVLRNRADALRFGRENTVYVDGEEPFSGGFRTAAFCDLVKERLAAKR